MRIAPNRKLTITEAAVHVELPRAAIKRATDRGELLGVRTGKHCYIKMTDLTQWVDARTTAAVPATATNATVVPSKPAAQRSRRRRRRRRGTGTITERTYLEADGTTVTRYEGRASVVKDGTRHRATFTAATRKEVEDWLTAQFKAFEARPSSDAETLTLDTFFQELEATARDRGPQGEGNWCARTLKHYRGQYDRYIKAKLGSTLLVDLTDARLIEFLGDLERDPAVRVPTHRDVHKTLSSILGHACDKKKLRTNPARGIKKLKKRGKVRGRIPTVPESRAILYAARTDNRFTWYYPLYRLAIATGMRQAEIFGVTRDMIDLAGRCLVIRKQLQTGFDGKLGLDHVKTESSDRIIPIDRKTVAALRLCLRRLNTRGFGPGHAQGLVFVTPDGGMIHRHNFRKRVHLPLLSSIGLVASGANGITFHKFRHAWNALAGSRRYDPAYRKAQMGHADIRTTLGVYGHAIEEGHRAMSDDIGAQFDGDREEKGRTKSGYNGSTRHKCP